MMLLSTSQQVNITDDELYDGVGMIHWAVLLRHILSGLALCRGVAVTGCLPCILDDQAELWQVSAKQLNTRWV